MTELAQCHYPISCCSVCLLIDYLYADSKEDFEVSISVHSASSLFIYLTDDQCWISASKSLFLPHEVKPDEKNKLLVINTTTTPMLVWLSVWSKVQIACGPADATAAHCLLLQ